VRERMEGQKNDLVWRMSRILTYSSMSKACRAMRPMVLALGGDASPLVASSVSLHRRNTASSFVRPRQSSDT
jgi:hypothetical protein